MFNLNSVCLILYVLILNLYFNIFERQIIGVSWFSLKCINLTIIATCTWSIRNSLVLHHIHFVERWISIQQDKIIDVFHSIKPDKINFDTSMCQFLFHVPFDSNNETNRLASTPFISWGGDASLVFIEMFESYQGRDW